MYRLFPYRGSRVAIDTLLETGFLTFVGKRQSVPIVIQEYTIVGTALGGLLASKANNASGNNGNGLLGGLFGNTNTQTDVVPVPVPMPVTEHQYYEDTVANLKGYFNREICNQKEFFDYAQGVSQRICDLEQRVAVDETSIAKNFEFMAAQDEWQNKFFDEKMRYADMLEQCRIQNATCKCIQGEVYASPSDLADPYSGRRMVIGSYVEPIGYCATNYYNGYNGYNNCGCNGYNWGGYNYGCC